VVAVRGVNVDVQSELAGPRVAAGAKDEGGLRAAEACIWRPDLDASVPLSAELDVAEDLAPECGESVGVGGGEDKLTYAACHVRHCTKEPKSQSWSACWRRRDTRSRLARRCPHCRAFCVHEAESYGLADRKPDEDPQATGRSVGGAHAPGKSSTSISA